MTTTCLRRSLCGETWFVPLCEGALSHRFRWRLPATVCHSSPVHIYLFVVYYVVENRNHHCHQAFDDVVGFQHIITTRRTMEHQVSVIIIIIVIRTGWRALCLNARAESDTIKTKSTKTKFNSRIWFATACSPLVIQRGRRHMHMCETNQLKSQMFRYSRRPKNKLGSNCLLLIPGYVLECLHTASMSVACFC